MTAPRVALNVTAAIRQGGGIGRYTRCLTEALVALRPAFALTLFWTDGAWEATPAWLLRLPGVRLRRIPLPERYATILWQRALLPLPIEALIGPQEVCHFPDFVAAPTRRARIILTIHDLSFRLVPAAADPKLRRYLERAVPRAVRRAALILADSDATRRDVVRELGAPEGRTATLYSGVGPEFRPVRDPARRAAVRSRYNLPARFVLSLGTLQPRKNYGRLIAAYALARAMGETDWDLVIVGRPGWLYADLAGIVAVHGVGGHVHFVTDAADDDLPTLYSLADLFALVSLYEGFGIPPLEAMACGTPTLVSNVSSLPEVVGEAGVLVDPLDVGAMAAALRRLMDDERERLHRRRAGFVQSARFTWERAAQELAGHYGRVAGLAR